MRKEFRKLPHWLNWIERPPSKRKVAVSSTAMGIPQRVLNFLTKRHWCSGNISDFHSEAPVSITGWRIQAL